MNEDQLEQLSLDWFREGGYEVAYGPDLLVHEDNPDGERENTRQILLTRRLRSALEVLNPDIPSKSIDDAIDILAKPRQPSLIANNRAFHEMVLEGVPVEFERNGERIGDRVKLFDFENPLNNKFLAVNQYTVHGTKIPRRPDVIVFVNGIPLAVLELKSPSDTNADIWKAWHQLQTYKAESQK